MSSCSLARLGCLGRSREREAIRHPAPSTVSGENSLVRAIIGRNRRLEGDVIRTAASGERHNQESGEEIPTEHGEQKDEKEQPATLNSTRPRRNEVCQKRSGSSKEWGSVGHPLPPSRPKLSEQRWGWGRKTAIILRKLMYNVAQPYPYDVKTEQ